MAIRYHIEKLDNLLNNLAGTLRVSILILDENGKQLSCIYDPNDYCSALQTVDGMRSKCHECDSQIVTRCKKSKRIEKHICHAGLLDLAMPIIKDGTVVAYIVLGRIRTALSPSFSRYDNLPATIYDSYQNIPYFSEEQLQHLVQLLPEIVFNSAITVEYDTFEEDIIPYINEHMQKSLSIPHICKRYHLSKNTLYRYFHEHFDCSVSEYITNIRINCARKMLTETNQTVISIAGQIGIDNYTYFCKLFKQKNGLTPTEYRKLYSKKTGEPK